MDEKIKDLFDRPLSVSNRIPLTKQRSRNMKSRFLVAVLGVGLVILVENIAYGDEIGLNDVNFQMRLGVRNYLQENHVNILNEFMEVKKMSPTIATAFSMFLIKEAIDISISHPFGEKRDPCRLVPDMCQEFKPPKIVVETTFAKKLHCFKNYKDDECDPIIPGAVDRRLMKEMGCGLARDRYDEALACLADMDMSRFKQCVDDLEEAQQKLVACAK